MPSALAQRIINACEKARKGGLVIPFCRSFFGIDPGVTASDPGKVYVSDGKEICPLGTLLLGRKRKSEDTAYVFNDACYVLGVNGQWTNGFLQSCDQVKLPKKPNKFFSKEFIDGFKVGLKVRSVIYRQQSTPEKGARQCPVY